MKISIITLFLFFALTGAQAQPVYEGPAKLPVKAFWEQAAQMRGMLEKNQLNGAASKSASLERLIGTIKTKDPAFDISPLQTELDKLKADQEALNGAKASRDKNQRNAIADMMAFDKKMAALFDMRLSTQVGINDLDNIASTIETYKKNTAEVMTMNRSDERVLEKYLEQVQHEEKLSGTAFKKLQERLKNGTQPQQTRTNYYELLYKQAYWDAAQKVYPAHEEFAAAYNAVTKMLNGLGSLEDMNKLAAKQNADKVSETKMPVATVKDAALEKEFIAAFNSRYKDEFKGTAIKAVVLTPDWEIKRHAISGLVTGRVREGAVVYKGADGKCYLCNHFYIQQEYVGGKFQTAKPVYVVYKGQEMLCENVR